jgi:2-polyprenyl-3-methyl-5-hydroxy-6-metoxy-1,4-benzoquinol methylase
MTKTEKDNLLRISKDSLYSAGVMSSAIEYCFQILKRHLRGHSVLEMGPAEGVMTKLLATTGMQLTLVEGSSLFCDALQKKFPKIRVEHFLFEEFEPHELFDNIVLGHVLEHVDDPGLIIKRAKDWLRPEGCIFAAVPNARSLHRQAAVAMGLLPCEDALNDLDLHHGHRRVFNPESFRSVFIQAGMTVDVFGGYWLKPLSNSQLESHWSAVMLNAFMQLGERYPDIAGEIYIVASNHKRG